ncbi:protein crumbs isoform X2 [Lepeophtheirus salmonis]|uniref:protein crumbs isoform X2 n=1 Tax=Lepeophtheirus salmonis TaxID=72036 RepID=UPI003AF39954
MNPKVLWICIGLWILAITTRAQESGDSDSNRNAVRYREAFAFSGASFIRSNATLSFIPGSTIAFSIRTCVPGTVLSQIGSNFDKATLVILGNGALVLSISVGENSPIRLTSRNVNVLDARWHRVSIATGLIPGSISLSIDGNVEASAVNEDMSILSRVDLSRGEGESHPLRVLIGMVACLRQGPGLEFSNNSTAVHSLGVIWGECLLPYQCSKVNWTEYTHETSQISFPFTCPESSSDCDQVNGVCLPESTSAPSCLCKPGFSGPTCTTPASSCNENPCVHGSSCTEDPSGGSGYSCSCVPPFSGTNCEIEKDFCENSPCVEGGFCFPQPAGFFCECSLPYYGPDCRNTFSINHSPRLLNNNPCDGVQCLHNGNCSVTSNGNVAKCLCSPGFVGNLCEISSVCTGDEFCPDNGVCLDGGNCECSTGFVANYVENVVVECQPSSSVSGQPETTPSCPDPNPCLNGGLCSPNETDRGFNCSCAPGFEGDDCSLVSPCGGECLNDGTCDEVTNTCVCASGYEGLNCATDINECSSDENICNQKGTCQNYNGGYRCICEEGWSGSNCESSLGCSSLPCKNDGTCSSETGYCVCPEGFSGNFCELISRSNSGHCNPNPCQNAGNCTSTETGALCSCAEGFGGPTCEDSASPCYPSNSCKNGAICIPTSGTLASGAEPYTCECSPEYVGLYCETKIDNCTGIVCPPGRVCMDKAGTHQCVCPTGFKGVDCAENIDECGEGDDNPCLYGGTCIDEVGKYSCKCTSGREGDNCEEDIDECSILQNICNHGICKNTAGSYTCYCRPGFTGNHCSLEFDECLSHPCKNGGSCSNLINSYECTCAPGFQGQNCEINIDECASKPCENDALCIDGINNFTCSCNPGFTGRICETNINECESSPCVNGGQCVDEINAYVCNCTDTGFEGPECQINIDECAPGPCVNNATCTDGINDYACNCFEGYGGKNCAIDISECLETPCHNGALCFEKSNQSLYSMTELVDALPIDVLPVFDKNFSYFDASGYVCSCMSGYEGDNCEVNINECVSSPCRNGECQDGIAEYICVCNPGYEGKNCEEEIDECERFSPCQHGSCEDGVADYFCDCEYGWGGKNCSVALIGCESVACLNGGTCEPFLIGESLHSGNCTCTAGFDGLRCQSRTTFSFQGDSYIKVPSNRSEGYELHMKFRTTLGNGLVAIGQGNTHFVLKMKDGKLNLHSNLISKYKGIFIGENLNNTEWQKVFVAVNSSHLTLGVNGLQNIQPINPTGENDTVFYNTYLGGIVQDQKILANQAPEFTGCVQDITVNGIKITEEDIKHGSHEVEEKNTSPGCVREDKCEPNPCQNNGFCKDLWIEYECSCHRPFLGASCQYNYTVATFGHENETGSIGAVDITNPAPYQSGVDISMFIRTRKENGFIFYFGSSLGNIERSPSYITGQLLGGNLVVNVFFDTKKEKFQVYTVNLSDGYRHFIRVVRMHNSMMVKVNETVSINHEIPSPTAFIAEKLYLGNLPDKDINVESETPDNLNTTTTTTTTISSVIVSLSSVLPPTDQTTQSNFNPFSSEESTSEFAVSSSAPTTLPESNTETTTTTVIPLTESVDSSLKEVRRKRDTEDSTEELEANENSLINSDNPVLSNPKPTFFKGIIQDIQISDGKNKKKIVELFDFKFTEIVNRPPSIGDVRLIDVMEGIVSDDTCKENPCENGGICQVTWNDYHCSCPKGYRGRNCDEKEYCFWYKCPGNSTCKSLKDGHECLTNATFNGINSTVSFTPSLEDNSLKSLNTILATFRSKEDGTLMFIGNKTQYIKLFLSSGALNVKIPEGSIIRTYMLGGENNTNYDDGEWHSVILKFETGVASGSVDNGLYEQLTIDAIDFEKFVMEEDTLITAGKGERENVDDLYFRGCIGELRIGGILLPFYNENDLVNSTAASKFIASDIKNVDASECILCFERECFNGGSCANPSEVFECECPKGFKDPTCRTNIDECVENSCQNGLCVDGVANYTCACNSGWAGWLCDTDIDECELSPCQNGGTCTQTAIPGDYSCNCLDDYEGHDCEELKIKTCEQEPCQNGGTCRSEKSHTSDDFYNCDCMPLYKGVDCELERDFCEEFIQPCKNNATCLSDSSSFFYQCKCTPGYEGKLCEDEIDECENNPCFNGGQCIDLLNSFKCNCTGTGYSGETCSSNINECLTQQPCIQGNCTDTPGSYQCQCLEGYCGTNCQREDPCQLSDGLCKNEGACIPACDSEPYYVCDCDDEWEGHDCSLKSTEKVGDILMIVGPIIGGILFITVMGILIFLVMARRKRRSEGKYKPANQELTSPRLQLDNIIKPPPEERLI